MLQIKYTPAFSRDLKKKAAKRKWNLDELAHVIDLICENSPESTVELKSRHSMHVLAGQWHGSRECHVANAGDWLLIWAVDGDYAYLQRTGSHDELFR
ncbi:type II toxin-antitoxin system YafQ family toxin [Atopobium sp. oral taxon 810]|uniref:type II toxin-antitoxin system YafQ family toxin n=1 Tax=Atopobium sp. oral taxon 810 TaxID=712158 RepID=UPI00039685FA|nr:addiction module toxin, RelE/StbE family [Atopobium sp. oral taxon 810 str. F0209]